MAKRSIAILSTILIVVFHLSPILSNTVYATDVTVANTVADVMYGYTGDDILCKYNYDTYYDEVTGYLKNCANSSTLLNDGDADFGSTIQTMVRNDFNNNMSAIGSCEFPNYDGTHFIVYSWWRSSYSTYTGLYTVSGGTNLACVGNYICSSTPFDVYVKFYSNGSGSFNGTYTLWYDNGADNDHNYHYTSTEDSANGLYYYNLGGMMMFSECPYYMTWVEEAFGDDGDYLGQSPYNYQYWYNVYNAIGSDESGFVIDRRTQHMIDETSGAGSSVSPSQYGFKQNSFGNILYGDNTTNQYLMVGYELNDASKSIGDKLYLKLNYKYLFSGQIHGVPISFDETYYDNVNRYDLYPLNNNNYINVDLSNKIFPLLLETDSTFETNYATLRDVWEFSNSGATSPYAQKPVPVSCDQMLYDFTKEHILTGYSMPVEYDTNFFNSVSLTYKGVTVSPTFNINTLWDGEFNGTYENRIDSAQIIVTESIYNAETGEESSPCTFIYDYLYGTYEGIGTLETIGEQLPSDKYTYGGQSLGYSSKELGYNLATGDFYSSSSGGNSSATGNVVNVYAGASSTGKVLIDIPFETAIANTPNLKQMYEDLKSGFVLSTTNSQSIIQLTRDTYTFIPAEIWGYIAITVVTCCGLAVYRNFRGR